MNSHIRQIRKQFTGTPAKLLTTVGLRPSVIRRYVSALEGGLASANKEIARLRAAKKPDHVLPVTMEYTITFRGKKPKVWRKVRFPNSPIGIYAK